eukprot:TRINITY_DN33506_c0_g1_i1.p1 TRINITY_DN33506_c0_g1~~TRINITY_DN33506_c0_g1_i1.p1  ORF type:complete len:641 (+),score=85.74 TRINITY_DN33506_c0_g1_i1:64-1986(+)
MLRAGIILLCPSLAAGCTSILVAKGAAADGATMTSHTDDCLNCDFRISKVPAQKHPEGSKRELFPGREPYPRLIAYDRGSTYLPENTDTSIYPWKAGEGDFKSYATVPQVPETYGYLDGGYGIMNEHGLVFGESTCGALLTTASMAAGGRAKFDIRELSRIALERCKTATCAVDMMGSMAEEGGYYGNDATQGEGGESLQIADPEQAWVFQILADDTGTSAVWAAQRVPDGQIAVVANQFTIRRLVLNDPDNFRYSRNIHEVANRSGLWHRETAGYPLDFTASFALSRGQLSPYANRRVWRVFTLANPSLTETLPSETSDFADNYPFSVAPDRQLTVADLAIMQRDHYEGTTYDMTKGIASGPYGDPSRFDPDSTKSVYPPTQAVTSKEANSGKFERAISIYRCSYAWISQTRAAAPGLDLIWFGQYAPHANQYVPVYAAAQSVPPAFAKGSLSNYDESVSYWVHAVVGNWADRFYRFAITDVKSLQSSREDAMYAAQPKLEHQAAALLKAGNSTGAASMLEEYSKKESDEEVAAWGKLFRKLVVKYKDGQIVDDSEPQYALKPTKLFYPRYWLEFVGFWKAQSTLLAEPSATSSFLVSLTSYAAVALVAFTAGTLIGQNRSQIGQRRSSSSLTAGLLVK